MRELLDLAESGVKVGSLATHVMDVGGIICHSIFMFAPSCKLMKRPVLHVAGTACYHAGVLGHVCLEFVTLQDAAGVLRLWAVDLTLGITTSLISFQLFDYLSGEFVMLKYASVTSFLQILMF